MGLGHASDDLTNLIGSHLTNLSEAWPRLWPAPPQLRSLPPTASRIHCHTFRLESRKGFRQPHNRIRTPNRAVSIARTVSVTEPRPRRRDRRVLPYTQECFFSISIKSVIHLRNALSDSCAAAMLWPLSLCRVYYVSGYVPGPWLCVWCSICFCILRLRPQVLIICPDKVTRDDHVVTAWPHEHVALH